MQKSWLFFCFFVILPFNQIHFVRDQQGGIISKLQAECLTLEVEITGLGLEVSVSLQVVDVHPLLPLELKM